MLWCIISIQHVWLKQDMGPGPNPTHTQQNAELPPSRSRMCVLAFLALIPGAHFAQITYLVDSIWFHDWASRHARLYTLASAHMQL